VQFQENLPNAPFALKGPNAEDLPLSLVTRDLWHVFYQNQMQINGGKNDGFVAWADSGGLVMGHYAQSRYSLRLWDVAKEFVLCDNFFQGAFGGSFLNHQYLISATAPFYPNAAQSVAKAQIATLQSDDPTDPRLKPLDKSPASAMTGPPQFGPSALTPDGYGVNTLAPPYWPTWIRDPENPDYAKADLPNVLVPQTHEHIGDKLSKKNVDWAWYAGAWQATLDQFKDSGGIPKIPNFQYHHQPFNYFKQQGPENRAERDKRLRDGGLGDEASTNKFFADAPGRQATGGEFLQAPGQPEYARRLRRRGVGRPPYRPRLEGAAGKPAVEKNMVVVVTVDEKTAAGWGPRRPAQKAIAGAQAHGFRRWWSRPSRAKAPWTIRCTTPRRSCA